MIGAAAFVVLMCDGDGGQQVLPLTTPPRLAIGQSSSSQTVAGQMIAVDPGPQTPAVLQIFEQRPTDPESIRFKLEAINPSIVADVSRSIDSFFEALHLNALSQNPSPMSSGYFLRASAVESPVTEDESTRQKADQLVRSIVDL